MLPTVSMSTTFAQKANSFMLVSMYRGPHFHCSVDCQVLAQHAAVALLTYPLASSLFLTREWCCHMMLPMISNHLQPFCFCSQMLVSLCCYGTIKMALNQRKAQHPKVSATCLHWTRWIDRLLIDISCPGFG